MQVTVIYTDVDGSLLGPGGCLFLDPSRRPTQRPAYMLHRALSLGVELVLVSGRSLPLLLEDARLVGAVRVIAELGALIATRDGTILSTNYGASPLRDQPPSGAMDAAESLLLTRYSGLLEPHKPWTEGRIASRLYRGFIPLDEANALLAAEGHAWLRLHDNGSIPRAYPSLDVPEVRAYHLVPLGVDKATGVALDMRERAIPPEAAVAIGDSAADIAMAAVVSRFYLLSSANFHATTSDSRSTQASPPHPREMPPGVIPIPLAMNLGWAEAVELVLRDILPNPTPLHLRPVLDPPSPPYPRSSQP